MNSLKSFFHHFFLSYKRFIAELFFHFTPVSFLLFIIPVFGHWLYFMTFYDPLEDLF